MNLENTKLRDRGTGGCRHTPYDKEHHKRNVAKQARNKVNRRTKGDIMVGQRFNKKEKK